MEIEEFAQPEVGVAVAVTALVASPSVRKTLRKGAAYGLAGVLLAGDAAQRFATSLSQGVRRGVGNQSQQTKRIEGQALETGAEVALSAE